MLRSRPRTPRPPRFAPPLLVLVVGLLAGCTSWREVPRPELVPHAPSVAGIDSNHAAPDSQASAMPRLVRVELVDHSKVMIDHPRTDGDSLRGLAPYSYSRKGPAPPVAVALKDVRNIREPRFAAGKSIGLFLLLGGIGLAIGLAIAFGNMSSGPL